VVQAAVAAVVYASARTEVDENGPTILNPGGDNPSDIV
jgi:hypothetical protein